MRNASPCLQQINPIQSLVLACNLDPRLHVSVYFANALFVTRHSRRPVGSGDPPWLRSLDWQGTRGQTGLPKIHGTRIVLLIPKLRRYHLDDQHLQEGQFHHLAETDCLGDEVSVVLKSVDLFAELVAWMYGDLCPNERLLGYLVESLALKEPCPSRFWSRI